MLLDRAAWRKGRRVIVSVAIVLVLTLLIAVNILPALLLRVPDTSLDSTPVDVIIVLGTPATTTGMVTPALRERVLRGVDLFKRGLAKYLILTGGPAHNQYVEADVMAKFAETKGVPANRIIEEKEARNTIENASRSVKIMRTRGWSKAIIVTSSAHLLRSNFIFSRHHIQYRMVACNDPLEQDLWTKIQSDQSEKYKTLATLLLRLK